MSELPKCRLCGVAPMNYPMPDGTQKHHCADRECTLHNVLMTDAQWTALMGGGEAVASVQTVDPAGRFDGKFGFDGAANGWFRVKLYRDQAIPAVGAKVYLAPPNVQALVEALKDALEYLQHHLPDEAIAPHRAALAAFEQGDSK